EVVDRAGRTRPVQHGVDRPLDANEVGDVVPEEEELRAPQVFDVREIACQEAVDADDRVATADQRVREMRSDGPGSGGNDDTHGEGEFYANRCRPRSTVSHMIFK